MLPESILLQNGNAANTAGDGDDAVRQHAGLCECTVAPFLLRRKVLRSNDFWR